MALHRLLILPAALLAVTVAAAGAEPIPQARKYESRHFSMQCEGREDPALVWALLERLETAYRDVGRQLGVSPEGKVPVMLYTEGEFPAHASVPHWAQGLFDGQIRLAVSWAGLREESLDRTLRHEYTHALVHARTGGNVPAWFSEGLAIASEGRDTEREREIVSRAGRLMPLENLHESFLTLHRTQLPLAYAESEAAVRYLQTRYGAQAVRALLTRVRTEKDFAAVLRDVTGATYAEFQAAWLRSIMEASG